MVLMLLYFTWGGFFPEPTFPNQVIFNFALFYPVGFMNGYLEDAGGVLSVYRIAILFNIMTYGLVIVAGIRIPLLLAGADFLTLFLFLYLGILMGKRTKTS